LVFMYVASNLGLPHRFYGSAMVGGGPLTVKGKVYNARDDAEWQKSRNALANVCCKQETSAIKWICDNAIVCVVRVLEPAA
jgi:hypothetical protein